MCAEDGPAVASGLATTISASGKITGSRQEFQRSVGRCRCAVAVVPDLCCQETSDWITSLAGLSPAISWILVTRFNRRNVHKCLKLSFPVEVVWLADLRRTLPEAVRDALEAPSVVRLCEIIERAEGLHPELRAGLLRACRFARPPRTIQGLCRAIDIPERRFRYLWKLTANPCVSPKGFADWLVLCTAVSTFEQNHSWTKVAQALGIKKGTLYRICSRMTGLTLGQVESRGPGFLHQLMEGWWIQSLE